MPSARALVLIYDIRGFTAASKRISTVDLGAFATAAHRAILDLFAALPPTFVKNLGDGHLLLWETTEPPDPDLVAFVVDGASRARVAFAAFVKGRDAAGLTLPKHVGVGVAFGEVSRSDDYYGVALNLAARLQNLARPEGLALDERVFETAAARDAGLKAALKRSRVRLKGLGSTLVWVDRPFTWARALAPVWKTAALLAVPLVAYLVADKNAARWIDDVGIPSLLRPIRGDGETRAGAASLRRELSDALLTARRPGGWIVEKYDADPTVEFTPWSSSQAICGLLRCPEVPVERLRELTGGLSKAFDEGRYVERGGVAYGWAPSVDANYTEAEPTLWTAAALAKALGRPGVIAADDRPKFLAMLERAQRASMAYRPLDGGAWNIFPNQKDLARHSPYTTSLALLTLLETRAAGLPWLGDEKQRDDLIRSTARFIVSKFLPSGSPPGWRRTGDPDDVVSLGLTLQDFGLLLRAEAEGLVELPPAILEAIPARLAALVGTSIDQQADAGEFRLPFKTPDGQDVSQTESINFLWHPWAIEAASAWLARDARLPGPAGDRRRVRRALGHLVVDMGSEAKARATKGYIFVTSETVYGLSSVASADTGA